MTQWNPAMFLESGTFNVASGNVVIQDPTRALVVNATPRSGRWVLAGRPHERVVVDLNRVRFRGRIVSDDVPQKSVSSLNWVATIQSGNAARASQDHLLMMVHGVNDLLRQQSFDTVNLVLKSVRPNTIGPELLVGLVRITSPVRSKLPAWAAFLNDVRREIQRRGMDAALLLRGLPAA